MLIETLVVVGVLVWIATAITLAAMLGAMFAPDKEKLIGRIVVSSLLLVPCTALVPLSFAAAFILVTCAFIVGVTIFGIRSALELIIEGIPELDDDGNVIETSKIKPTAPWV